MIRTRAQLLADGIPSSTIHARCRSGYYIQILPGVYSTGTPSLLTKTQAVIAWLPTAIISHTTAAWLQGMLPEPPLIDATVPKETRRATPEWLRLHRRTLDAAWITEFDDLPITAPPLTLLDCLNSLPHSEANALIDHHIDHTTAHSLLTLSTSHLRGSSTLAKQLRAAATRFASEPERLFARALHDRGLHLLANHPIGNYYADFADERSRTIIEIDGREFHSAPAVFRQDRRRQNHLQLAGWLVLRYAAADIFQSLNTCADEAATVIRRRRHNRWKP
ncbi:DUF559 domain-containing protein [Nocardia yamanashiensis]|uniref:DUF559 domain-containing protein n=1 Tax=Nocardia yamanashiensis TaxID=209247 RepID=UPI0009FBDCAA|nr:DUF559 domain-containing protein [Nocardia yamanashiensis]